ncbi:unnamed protein product [Allacma fusca]|uniref:Uncharacterized protein n=1 Tax=Allacma fusca TaxID=39272 RepID=A0A8J2K259_9HEXA|nr:unnamed protein product [Allacma fusca]
MVHSNSSLSAAQKLQHLKVALKGESARLIENVQVTDANYQGAWDVLQDRNLASSYADSSPQPMKLLANLKI